MASSLEGFVNKTVTVITSDGRVIVVSTSLVAMRAAHPPPSPLHSCTRTHAQGTLKGFDQTINVIMDETQERVFSRSQGVEVVPLGLYIIRGDNISVVGEMDEASDKQIDFSVIKADPPNQVSH